MATTVFIAGCNLRCAYCHNPGLLAADAGHPSRLDALMEHVNARRSWIDGVVVTGGEPTADRGLFALLDEFAALCLPVKLDTNGTSPQLLRMLLESHLVAAVALDVKALPEHYARLTGVASAWESVAESISVLLASGIPHEFRTTVYPGAVSLDDLPTIASYLEGGDRYVLQQFRPERTLDSSASETRPYTQDALCVAAELCSPWIETTVRGT